MGERYLPFSSFRPFLPSPATKRLPENHLAVWELCKLAQWGLGQSPGRIRILVYFELENLTWRQ